MSQCFPKPYKSYTYFIAELDLLKMKKNLTY